MKAASDQSSDHQRGDNDDDDVGSQGGTGHEDSTTENSRGDAGGVCTTLKQRCANLCADVYFPRRYTVVLLLFVGMCVVHAQRVNVGVAVVTIVDSRHRFVEIEEQNISNTSVIAVVKDSVRRSA